jgi:type I restriction enzyme S subunit
MTWDRRPFPEVIDFLEGPGIMARDFRDSGVPLVRLAGLTGGDLLAGCNFLDEDAVARRWSHFRLREGDVLLSTSATLGRVARTTAEAEGAIPYTGIIRMRPAVSDVDAHFIKFLLKGPDFQRQVEAMGAGSVMNHFGPTHLRKMTVLLPPLAVQLAVVQTLSALDDKIECNQRLAQTADTLWRTELAAVVADAVDTQPLSALAQFVNGKNFTKDASGTGRPVIRIAEMSKGVTAGTVRNDVSAVPDNICRSGDLLFAWSGSLQAMRWFAKEGLVNQHIFKVVSAPGVPIWLLHGYLDMLMPFYKGIAADKATTMGHIKREHLNEPVPLLPSTTIAELDATCGPLWSRALAAERESLVLAELRDALLPKLLSGEVRVEEAEEQVEEAV